MRPYGSADTELSLLAAAARAKIKSHMVAAANRVEVPALVGDTARATMLAALMGGQALTSSELAELARVSRATASEHLGKLTQARLLTVTQKRLLPDRFTTGGENAGKHQGRGRAGDAAALSAAFGAGRC